MSDITDSSVAGDEPLLLVEDYCVSESEYENQIILTSQHAPVLTSNQRSNVNKQVESIISKLYKAIDMMVD